MNETNKSNFTNTKILSSSTSATKDINEIIANNFQLLSEIIIL